MDHLIRRPYTKLRSTNRGLVSDTHYKPVETPLQNTHNTDTNNLIDGDQVEPQMMNAIQDEQADNILIDNHDSNQPSIDHYDNSIIGADEPTNSAPITPMTNFIYNSNNNLPQSQSAPNKRSPPTLSSGSGIRLLTTNIGGGSTSISTDRLTILEEPNRLLEYNNKVYKNIATITNNIREPTILSARTTSNHHHVNGMSPVQDNHDWSASADAETPPTTTGQHQPPKYHLADQPRHQYNHQTSDNLQQQPDQHLYMIDKVSIALFLVIVGLIVYKWFYRKHYRDKASALLKHVWPARLFPSPSIKKPFSGGCSSLHTKRTTSVISSLNEGDHFSRNSESIGIASQNKHQHFVASSFNNSNGEHIQLVEQKPSSSNHSTHMVGQSGENEDEEIIQVVDSIPTTTRGSICDDRPSKMVILKRKLAKNSLVVAAAKTTKPRVKLITARVKKFIDDEAEDMRVKSLLDPTKQQPWRYRILALFYAPFQTTTGCRPQNSSDSGPKQGDEVVEKVATLAQNDATTIKSSTDQMPSINREAKTPPPLEVEIHQTNRRRLSSLGESMSGNNIEMTTLNGGRNVAGIDQKCDERAHIAPVNGGLTIPTSPRFTNDNHFAHQPTKLSPSPVMLNDGACSSITSGGCSLFSPSPIDQQLPHGHHATSSCGCQKIAHPGGARLGATYGVDVLGGVGSGMRSKSQGHSPCQLASQSMSSSGSPGATYQPCCSSVSPSALNAAAYHPPSSYHPQQQQHNHNHHPNHDQLVNHKIRAMSAQTTRYAVFSKPDCYRPGGGIECSEHQRVVGCVQQQHLARFQSPNHSSGLISGKCNSSHIKRQYENYYDDEQEDAYQRLTASLRMELGLGFDHHHEVNTRHSADDASPLNYAATTGNMDDLLHFNRCGSCQQQRNLPANKITSTCLINTEINTNQIEQLPAALVNTSADTNQIPFAPIQSFNECKCCQKASNFVGTNNQNYDSLTPMNRLVLAHRSCATQDHQQQQVIVGAENGSHYLFKSGAGSAGELQVTSGASTSLGESDNGFMNANICTNNNNYASMAVCPNLLCMCQSNSVPMPTPPMSILVQQPSMATPPPPAPVEFIGKDQVVISSDGGVSSKLNNKQLFSRSSDFATDEKKSITEPETSANQAIEASSKTNSSNKSVNSITALAPLVKSTCCGNNNNRSKWKPRRRLSQKHIGCDSYYSHSQVCSRLTPRRMSIAGDQVAFRGGTSTVIGINSPASILNSGSIHGGGGGVNHLQHRASIASDGSWNQQNIYNHLRFIQLSAQVNSSSSSSNQQHQGQIVSPSSSSHRPSDASLYEPHYCASALNSCSSAVKSNCSSSGGSSSGIGASGSACTNTPTSAFPYGGGFATKGDDFSTHNHHHNHHHLASSDRQSSGLSSGSSYYQSQHQCTTMSPYLMHSTQMAQMDLANDDDGGFGQATTPNRKFSLPVQLESQTADRLSPSNRARLLFEKNFHQLDSFSISSSASNHQHHTHHPGEAVQISLRAAQISGSPCIRSLQQQQERYNYGRPSESRRNSQTITRQSSFWLEDNSVESIFSSTTSGPFGQQSEDSSQIDLNQLAGQDETKQPSSQRPSISSLILSGDSIDSVKQRPLPNTVPPPEEVEGGSNNRPTNEHHPIEGGSRHDESNCSKVNKGSEEGCSSNGAKDDQQVSGPSSPREKRVNQFRTIAQMRNRLSSSSTSSTTTSSPSPDFSRPSDRILALASKSSTISKRRLFGKLRSRRYPRLGSSTNANETNNSTCRRAATHQHSAPGSTSSCTRRKKDESEEDDPKSEGACAATSSLLAKDSPSCEQDNYVDREFSNIPSDRPISDLNSASLERQCRDLWKLRATLHDDSCVGDNWSNYHQRLNRRYDSGYKSIENQLSSSLEGNVLVQSSNLQVSVGSPTREAGTQQATPIDSTSLLARPQSGCSGSVAQSGMKAPTLAPAATITVDNSKDSSKLDEQTIIQMSPSDGHCAKFMSMEITEEDPIDTIDGKLTDLELDDVALECLLNEPMDRESQSRSSKSSNEEEVK